MVDRVLPEVPIRQWVLTLPYLVRFRCAYDAKLASDMLRAFTLGLFAELRRRASRTRGTRGGQCGAVTFIQRFSVAWGSILRLVGSSPRCRAGNPTRPSSAAYQRPGCRLRLTRRSKERLPIDSPANTALTTASRPAKAEREDTRPDDLGPEPSGAGKEEEPEEDTRAQAKTNQPIYYVPLRPDEFPKRTNFPREPTPIFKNRLSAIRSVQLVPALV